MKAILTKIIPCTNTKPTRIKAYTEGGNAITLSWSLCEEQGIDNGHAHLFAAKALCRKMGWGENIIRGGTPTGYAFVFTNTRIREGA